jgi:hypothetical protein
VTGCALPAFARSSASASDAVSAVVTRGTSASSSMIAALTARSAAALRTRMASGTRKATTTSEVVAATSRTSRYLIGASR